MKRKQRTEQGGLQQPPLMSQPDPNVLRQLLDLAYDVSSYLRRSPSAAVRASAALLLAGSLAACNGLGPDLGLGGGETTTVAPLSQEVREGLPSAPGRYVVYPDSLFRNQQGVYFFDWRGQNEGPDTRHQARASLVRLQQSDQDWLEVIEGQSPVLHLRKETPINLASTGGATGGGSAVHTPWLPFFLMTNPLPSPVYYDPPSSSVPAGSTVQGSRTSTTPRPPAERVSGVSGAVSGRAGGAGSGTAATSKSGASISGSNSSSGGKSGVLSSPKSGGFSSGGKSGGSVGSSSS